MKINMREVEKLSKNRLLGFILQLEGIINGLEMKRYLYEGGEYILTPKEDEFYRLLLKRHTKDEIKKKLNIKETRYNNLRRNIVKKLDFDDLSSEQKRTVAHIQKPNVKSIKEKPNVVSVTAKVNTTNLTAVQEDAKKSQSYEYSDESGSFKKNDPSLFSIPPKYTTEQTELCKEILNDKELATKVHSFIKNN